MDQPSAAEIRTWSPPALNWTSYGFPAPTGSDPDLLTIRIAWAAGELFAVTGRTLDSITSPEEVAIAQKVLVVFTVKEAMGGGKAALAVMDAPWLKSFTAGSYSETRFSPAEIAGGSAKAPPYAPGIWALLWALMTDEKRDDWTFRLGGPHAPATTFIDPGFGDRPTADLSGLMFGQGIDHGYPFG